MHSPAMIPQVPMKMQKSSTQNEDALQMHPRLMQMVLIRRLVKLHYKYPQQQFALIHSSIEGREGVMHSVND